MQGLMLLRQRAGLLAGRQGGEGARFKQKPNWALACGWEYVHFVEEAMCKACGMDMRYGL